MLRKHFSGRGLLCAALAGCAVWLGGCNTSQQDALLATVWPEEPHERAVLTDAGFSSSDPLGYILFEIEPLAREARIGTSMLVEADTRPRQVIVSGEAPAVETRPAATLAAHD